MADPPPIRRNASKPPPIPPVRPPIAPPAVTTEVVTESGEDTRNSEVSEITRHLEVPDALRLVSHMLELVSSEAEALLAGDDADGKLADLNVRIALASWDGLHRPDEALRHLELAEQHPLVPRLWLAAALADRGQVLLETAQHRADVMPDQTVLAIELAEAWLFRQHRPAVAAALADRAVAGTLPNASRAHVIELATFAHAAADNWARVLELRRTAHDPGGAPDEIAATAALELDRAGDPAAALALCEAALARDGERTPATLGWLRVLDVAIDAAARGADRRVLDLLVRRADLIAALPGGALDALATRHVAARELASAGRHSEAAAMWARLGDDEAANAAGAARRIALVAATHEAARAGDRGVQIATRRRLIDGTCAVLAAAHAWRILELASIAGLGTLPASSDAEGGAGRDLVRAALASADSVVAERWIDLLDHASPTPATIARFEARGGLALRWAAAVAEQLGDAARAIELWRRAAAGSPDWPRLGTEHDHVVRLLRGGSGELLAAAYAVWSSGEPDPRSAAALQCGCGIVELLAGDFVTAEASLQRAAELAPRDPFCRAALAAVYRAGKRYDQLASVLAELSISLTGRDARAAAAREYAELLDEHLGDPRGARGALERMIAERPDDDDAMLVLAKLYDRDYQWERSIELRKRALELAATPDRRTSMWIEIALREEQRGDRDAALAALDRAVEASPHRADVLREQARLHDQAGNHERALELVRAELALAPPIARRLQLQAQLAHLLARLGREPETVVQAYLEILSVDPEHAEALAGIEHPARTLGLWGELVRAFRGAPETAHNVEVLGEAFERTAQWADLAKLRRRQLEQAGAPIEKARRARALATLYQHELGDLDAAIQMLAIARTTSPDQDQVAILLELGALHERLDLAADAITAYEGVLELDAKNLAAIERVEPLYEKLGRELELARVLELRAELATEPAARATVLARVAAMRATRGEVDAAIASYTAAFSADPTNRDVFTEMERVCYSGERWAAAMKLYEIALVHVEGGAGRAYRLGDLYTRRGNLQLQYLGDLDGAIASFRKVIEVDSQPASAAQVLERVCSQRGDWSPLIAAWERRAEVQRDPQRRADALRAAIKLTTEHIRDGRAAARLHRQLLAVDPGDLTTAALLERYYEEHHDRSGLIEVLKMRLQHARDQDESVELMKKIARASEEGARDVETATAHYQKVLELQPENREALDALGRIYESTEQWAEFLDVTRRLVKVTSDRNVKALLYFKCGSVMEAKFGREHDAIRYYEGAIKTSPSCLPAVHGLRDLYRRREEWPRVLETLELEVKLWTEDKERAGVFAQIGRIYEKHLGDGARAMEYYARALEVDPECLPANQSVFEHHFDRGEWDQALPLGRALAQKQMRDGDPTTRSEFYRKHGVVARMTGDAKAAADSFVVALEIKPTNSAALDDLGTLAREMPDVWDFEATYRELEKVYRKRGDAAALLARVYVGRAAIVEREGDLDAAAALYRQALELAPADLAILSALVDFHAGMRHWDEAIAAIQSFVEGGASEPDRLAVLMRQATIHADGEMDAPRAIAVLLHVIEIAPQQRDAYYLLAQQHFLIGHYAEARAAIDRVIELASQPGQPLIPEDLARYYYYKGRTLEAAGDTRSAASQYRRAIEYDPGYAPPALVLARRAADGGDQRQAENLLLETAHAAMDQGGLHAAVPLQRGLARILLASGDRPAAIEAYRGILAVDPEGANDRVALAEIYAVDDPPRAIAELRKVLDRDIHHAPAYRMLASFHARTGDRERAQRVLTALDLLGFAEEDDHRALQQLRVNRHSLPLRRGLDDANRERLLLTTTAREPLGEVWSAFAEPLSARVPPPALGDNLVPCASGEPRLAQLAQEVGSVYQVDVDVLVADRVPGLLAATAFPRRQIVLDRTLLAESELALRFLFGYAFEAIRGGYAVLLQLGARQRRELAQLLRALLEDDAPLGPAADLVASASPRAHKLLERHVGTSHLDPGAWFDGMLACAKRAGLVACDDFAAAIWMIARLSGERVASHDETVALGAVLGGPDLVRFYLSDGYQQIRDLLALAA
jgi:tetratricopeptide (TPR) repeat protein